MNSIKSKILTRVEKIALRLNQNSDWVLQQLRIYRYFDAFEERHDDIYVATYQKAGTTWLQMILYQMLFRAGDNFNHIYDVSPWPSNEAFLGLTAEKTNQLPSPRILKTHNPYSHFSKEVKGRFIYLYREGKDIAASVYHHEKNYLDPEQNFDAAFKKHFQNEPDNWFSFNSEWLMNTNNFPVLYISYEQLKTNFEQTVMRIAGFLKVELSDEQMQSIQKFSSFEYMKSVEHKFGEQPTKESQVVCDQFIRKGETGQGNNYLNEEQKLFYEATFNHLLSRLLKEKNL